MRNKKNSPASKGNSKAEETFIDLFCDVYGPEKGQYVYLQYPVNDIYGRHRTIDFAINSNLGKVAFEIDGTTWHDPSKISSEKYEDDLLKQNSIVYDGWKIYRWTDNQIYKNPERIKDELVTFLGTSPAMYYMEDNMPVQNGKVFELRGHQEEALDSLKNMRENYEKIALVQGATGSGKSAIGILDAKAVGKRTLFLAHTKELVAQGYDNFKKLWLNVSVGKFVEDSHDTDTYVVCGSIQSITRNLEMFKPNDFGYILIDECHHASADSYKKILQYFQPDFILGLTATPERADGEDLLEIFKNVAHRLDIKEAVETGVLCEVRCIRVKTNIDLQDVRINGFKYNSLDLETKVFVPERNKLIVDTYLENVINKPTVIFCTSVAHADKIAELLNENGVKAASVSGKTKSIERKNILAAYENKEIAVLCACDLLNEGWDSPHTEVLFMARPTMSKTIYLQQLGRGMRKYQGKECLMVFDFVDNANMFNCPYSLHRLLNISEYNPGGLVLGQTQHIKWDKDMFRKGERPEALIDFPIHATDYEIIDLFNWQDKAKNMISQIELTRKVVVQSETIEKYIRDGKIVPDMEVPIGESRTFKYFNPERVKEFCKQFKWKEITNSNKKQLFIEMVEKMTMSYSYKPVFMISFISVMNEDGTAQLDDVVDLFAEFYEDRKNKGLVIEKGNCIFTKDSYTKNDVKRLILNNPFKRFEDMSFMHHSKYVGTIQLDSCIAKNLTVDEINLIEKICTKKIEEYYK